jgi:phospholipid/cholesterol/gamma-HCH transport system permease protein
MSAPQLTVDPEAGVLRPQGDWRIRSLDTLALPALPARDVWVIDGRGLHALDTTGAFFLLRQARTGGAQSVLGEMNASHRAVFELVAAQPAPYPPAVIARPSLLYALGMGVSKLWLHLCGISQFVGELADAFWRLGRQPGRFRVREFTVQLESVFVHAIPIAMAMMFLLGVVFAYLLGVQTQRFGANILVVDGLVAAILRELSPTIVAILIAGRSGAAMTAQLGTMKVNEEVDAISVLGLSPQMVLVMPRILALFVALPLLVFLGDIAGLLGGALIAHTQLGIEFSQFFDRLEGVLDLATLIVGLGKSLVFAAFIGVIACRMGLTVSRDARSVGMNTTSTVVQSIVAIIVLNALFAVAFVRLDI